VAEASHLHLAAPKPQCIGPRCALIHAQSVKLSESWPKFKIFDLHEVIKKPAQGQKKVPRRMKM
jgi:hypothetical protein